MSNLTLKNHEGKFVIDSLEVSSLTGKPHNDLMKSIRSYTEYLNQGNFSLVEFFIESTYQDNKGETRPCYLLTRKGCDMVANKMTGEKGVLFTAAYVTKFEEMETQLRNPYLSLSPELQAIILHDKKIQAVESRVDKLENVMTIDYGQQEELRRLANIVVVQTLGGKSSQAYKLIGSKAFSELWRHLKRTFNVNSYRNIPVVEFSNACEVVKNWKPEQDLELMIIGANTSQKGA